MTMPPILRRIIAGVSANLFAQFTSILIQLASVPIFLSHWTLSNYGVWLMISAVPAYFSMADVGIVTVAGNRMTMAMGKGDTRYANVMFHSAQLFVILMCMIVAVTALPIILLSPLPGLNNMQVRLALVILVAGVMLSLWLGLSGAAFKSTNRYSQGASLEVIVRLLEWFGGICGLLLVGSFVAVAFGMLLGRAGGSAAAAWWATRVEGLTWGVGQTSWPEIKKMARPALGFMTFPIANALSLQGFTLLTGNLLGPASVAVFNTYRSIARVAVQATSVLSHALWPEFARMFGRGEHTALRKIVLRTSLVGLVGAVMLSLLLYYFSPYLLSFWTKGKIAFEPHLMSTILLYAAIAGAWHIPRVVLMATNTHSLLGGVSMAIGTLALGCALPLGREYGAMGLTIAMIIGEGLVMIFCLWQLRFTFFLKKSTFREWA